MFLPVLPSSTHRKRPGWRLIAALFISAALVFVSLQTHWLDKIRESLSTWIYEPISRTVQAPLRFSWRSYQTINEYSENFAQNKELIAQNNELRAQVQLLYHYQAENRRLRMLMDSVASVSEPVLIAELDSDEIEGYRETITVNKGSNSGIYEHQPVIDPFGLVGQVIHVYPSAAEVMLITDARSRVPVYVQRTNQRALVSGTMKIGVLNMPFLRLGSDIKEGDKLMSSGLGGVFPRGYPVAIVTAVHRNQNLAFLDVEVRPLAHLESMLEVLLLDQRQLPDAVSSIRIPVGPPTPPVSKAVQEKP